MNLNSYDYIVNADTHTNVLPRDTYSYDIIYWLEEWKEKHCNSYLFNTCFKYLTCERCPYA